MNNVFFITITDLLVKLLCFSHPKEVKTFAIHKCRKVNIAGGYQESKAKLITCRYASRVVYIELTICFEAHITY